MCILKVGLISAVSGIMLGAFCAGADEFKPDENTLFLAHFNTGIAADVAKGKKENEGGDATITTGGGGKFGEGLACRGIGKGFLTFPVAGNLDVTKGTLEFWVKMDLPKDSLYCFFTLPTTIKKEDGNISAGLTMHYKGADTNFVFYPGTAAAGDFYVFKKARWEKDEWHHIAITWGDNGMSLFIDGRKTNSEGYKGGLFLGDKKNEQNLSGIFSIGGFDAGTCTIEGVIDELRISDIVRYEEDFDPNK